MSNFLVEGQPVGGLDAFTIKEFPLAQSHKRLKIGFFGLASAEWPDLIVTSVTEEFEYIDFVEKGREMTRMLKAAPHNCDLVIALTHMRCPDDRKLAENVPEIDLILGGHDHSYVTEVDQGTGVFMIKSGTDFEEFNDIDVLFDVSEQDYADAATRDTELVKHIFSPQKRMLLRVEKVPITVDIPTNPKIEAHIKKYATELNKKMNQVCGYFDVDIEGRFEYLRYQETNCGNFVADLIRTEFNNCEVVILNCGTLRSNSIIPKGQVTNKTLADLLPMYDKIILLKVPGDILL